jgi:signal transduction histidine kinase
MSSSIDGVRGVAAEAETVEVRSAAPAGRSPVPDRFFRDMVGSMRNGVIAVTREGHVAVLNAIACQVLNVPVRATNLGTHYSEVLQSSPEIVRILGAAFESDYLPNRAEMRLASGPVIGYTLSLIRDDDGRTTGAALFFKDLTRVEQIEERERLRDRLAALGEMAAAIAHEVKNPLAGIEVMAGLLKRRLAQHADAQSMLNDIINEAKMANAIVLEVLEFVRPIRLQVEPVSLGRVLQDALYMADNLVARRQTKVSLQVPDDLPAIEGDPHQLRQLFTNLLTNAYEALAGQGAVAVSVHVPAEDRGGLDQPPGTRSIAVDVTDNGPGVPDDSRDRIFGPFFTTKPRGSGLGLAIVRKIVDAHDGRITLCVPPGGGARFRVALPVTGLPDRTTLPSLQDYGAPGGPRQRSAAAPAKSDKAGPA